MYSLNQTGFVYMSRTSTNHKKKRKGKKCQSIKHPVELSAGHKNQSGNESCNEGGGTVPRGHRAWLTLGSILIQVNTFTVSTNNWVKHSGGQVKIGGRVKKSLSQDELTPPPTINNGWLSLLPLSKTQSIGPVHGYL